MIEKFSYGRMSTTDKINKLIDAVNLFEEQFTDDTAAFEDLEARVRALEMRSPDRMKSFQEWFINDFFPEAHGKILEALAKYDIEREIRKGSI